VNFAVRKFPGYGKLSGKSLDELRAGERVAVGRRQGRPAGLRAVEVCQARRARRRQVRQRLWAGRPGWHIECSAMSCALLGEPFDIHGGGMDLQFPHHENEIAQSEGARAGSLSSTTGCTTASSTSTHEKMSKSLGNFFTIRDVLSVSTARRCASSCCARITAARSTSATGPPGRRAQCAAPPLHRARHVPVAGCDARRIDWQAATRRAFKAAMDDDFNTPGAHGRAVRARWRGQPQPFDGAGGFRELRALGATLGLLQQPPSGLPAGRANRGLDEAHHQVAHRGRTRNAAKKARDFAAADRIRHELLAAGHRAQGRSAARHDLGQGLMPHFATSIEPAPPLPQPRW
jgi:cysteinyl-tRNA synthetase